jgi:predicted ester cyclase
MASITETAEHFFAACEAGHGWLACQADCHPDATFSVQADALAGVNTLQGYADWMQGLLTLMPDAGYDLKAFATDEARQTVVAYAVFSATHTGEGGPVPPTGKHTHTDYVYAMRFEGGKIRHMDKIWNDGFALRELGWA